MVLGLACRLKPSSRSSPATVSAETRWPRRVSSAASFRVDFVVQRTGDIGSPRSSGSTNATARKSWEVDDGLWTRIEPLMPVVKRRSRHPGRRRLDDRQVLCGILFVLHTGIPWRFLPQGNGLRLGDDVLEAASGLERGRSLATAARTAARRVADGRRARPLYGCRRLQPYPGDDAGPATGPSPVDQGKTGSKHHVIVEAHGIPLATITTGGNRNDVSQARGSPRVRGN